MRVGIGLNPLSVCTKHGNQIMTRPLGTLLLPTAGTECEWLWKVAEPRDISSSEASRHLVLKASTARPVTSLLGHDRIIAERDGWNNDGLGKGWGQIEVMSGKPGRMHSSLGPWVLQSFSPSYTSDYKRPLKCVQDMRHLSSVTLEDKA